MAWSSPVPSTMFRTTVATAVVQWELQLSGKVSLVVAEDTSFPLWLEMKREQEDDNGSSEV